MRDAPFVSAGGVSLRRAMGAHATPGYVRIVPPLSLDFLTEKSRRRIIAPPQVDPPPTGTERTREESSVAASLARATDPVCLGCAPFCVHLPAEERELGSSILDVAALACRRPQGLGVSEA